MTASPKVYFQCPKPAPVMPGGPVFMGNLAY